MRAPRHVLLGPHQGQARRVRQGGAVPADRGAAALDVVAQPRQPRHPERRARLVEAVVVAEVDHVVRGRVAGVAIPGARRHRVGAEGAHSRRELIVGGQDRAALADAELLLREEREAAEPTRGTRLPSWPKLGPDGLRGVFDQRDPARLAELGHGTEIHRVPAQVHRDDRARARPEAALDGGRVEVRADRGLDVAQHGPGAGVSDSIRRGDERERGHDDLVTRSELERRAARCSAAVPLETVTACGAPVPRRAPPRSAGCAGPWSTSRPRGKRATARRSSGVMTTSVSGMSQLTPRARPRGPRRPGPASPRRGARRAAA